MRKAAAAATLLASAYQTRTYEPVRSAAFGIVGEVFDFFFVHTELVHVGLFAGAVTRPRIIRVGPTRAAIRAGRFAPTAWGFRPVRGWHWSLLRVR
jgi:hypothetical protein